MSEEPYLTEWTDLDPYPGPTEHETIFEALVTFTDEMGRVIHTVAQGINGWFEAVLPAFDDVYKTIAGFSATVKFETQGAFMLWPDPLEPVPNPHKDKDRHIQRTGSHGPYEGSGYNHHGRKMY